MQGWSGNVGCARAFSTARSVVLGTCLAACLCVPLSAIAQQPGTAATPPVAGRTTAASPARTTTAKAAATKAETAAAAPASEAGLRQRIEQLEEQLVEMQVTIGTLDSLAKGGGSSSSGVYRGGGNNESSGGDPARVAALETQVRALAAQVDQLTVQIRQLNARGSTAPTPVANTVPLAPASDSTSNNSHTPNGRDALKPSAVKTDGIAT